MTSTPARGSTVLLYSGGLDSYCLAHLYRPDVLLMVDTGSSYDQAERAMSQPPPGLEDRVHYVKFSDLGQFERAEDLILPARNAHLVLLAANYADTIYLGATAGDRVKDKDQGFADQMNELLAHLYQPQWWLKPGRRVRVELPIKNHTKSELVAEYLKSGGEPAALVRRTYSCYYPGYDHEPCGYCKPCVRRYAALLVNGVDPDVNCHPTLAQLANHAASPMWDRGEAERRDTLEAYRLSKALQEGPQ